jgi:iron-sulfur cluster repair protein YtfE (RIC family)
MDVYQTLLQDHRTIQQIFGEIERTDVSEVERRERLFRNLREELEAHVILEENIFYPEIDKFPIAGELVDVAFDEHAEFDAILHEISELPVAKSEWLERFAELKDMVQQHLFNEENRLFPAARKELDDSRAEQLGRQIEELKQRERLIVRWQAPGKWSILNEHTLPALIWLNARRRDLRFKW